jgi:hypothetical protein
LTRTLKFFANMAQEDDFAILGGKTLYGRIQYPKNWPLDRDPYYMETNMPGVFAAGDVRHNSVKRCASAVGEGAMAVTFRSPLCDQRLAAVWTPRDEILQWLSLVSGNVP